MRPCEFKKRYDPDLDKYVKKHIYSEFQYGEGLSDVFKSVGSKILRRTGKKLAKSAATKTGEYAGYKAGDDIVRLLRENKTPSHPIEYSTTPSKPKELTAQEVNDRVNQILSGGKLRRWNFI